MRHLLDLHSPALPVGWVLSGTPRALHRFLLVRSVVAAIALIGCVPAAHYEEAQSARDVAQEAERRTAQRLAELEQELERLTQEQAQAGARLSAYGQEASQAAFERTHLEKQRDEHAELAAQLRGELARVGDHLRFYAENREELAERLEAAQAELEQLQTQLAELRETALGPAADSPAGAEVVSEPDPQP